MAKTPKILRRNAVLLKVDLVEDYQLYYEDIRPAAIGRLSR